MSKVRFYSFLLAVVAACIGYFVFALIGFPVPALTGATTGVACAALLGVKAELPKPVRNACILVLGINIGTGVTPEVLQTAGTWPLSLAVMAVTVVMVLALTQLVLRRFFNLDRDTAVLAAAPGHLSYVLSIADDMGKDVGAIAIIQTVRVLCLTLLVPPFITFAFGANVFALGAETRATMMVVGVTIALSIPLALVLSRIKIPAAWLVAGMITSALGHGTELLPGSLPPALGTGALMMLGLLIGSRFAMMPPRVLVTFLAPGLVVTAISISCAVIAMAFIYAFILPQPGLLILAFAPGGVEAMTAMALSLGYDPAFVAAHHVFRLFVLSLLMPIIAAHLSRSKDVSDKQ